MLNSVLGTSLPTDGIAFPDLRTALQTFQSQHGLPVSGFAGPDTIAALQNASAAQPPAPPAAGAPGQELEFAPMFETLSLARRDGHKRRVRRDAFQELPDTLVILFEYNSTKLRGDAGVDSVVIAINAAFQFLEGDRAGGKGKIILHGFASQEGSAARNSELSRQRAQRIKALLVDGGIPEESIQVISHGADSHRPTLQENRRVEVEFKP